MKSKRKRKNRKKEVSSKKFFILAIFIISGLLSYFFLNYKAMSFVGSNEPREELASSKFLINVPLTTYPSPTPTEIPTPTPIPLVGYCLNVPVLLYHHIQPQSIAIEKKQTALSVDNGVFDQQVGYLISSGYNLITAQELVDALKNKSGLPAKSMLITLDDGYSDGYQYAYPVIQKYHIKVNLMIPTGLLGGADYMSWDNLREMYGSGLIYITDHTWSHYAVSNGSEDKIKYEIETAKMQLENNLGQSVNIFTYPYGSFNNTSINILRQGGFVGAFSTIPGHWQCDSFIMALHRTRIGNSSMPYYGF